MSRRFIPNPGFPDELGNSPGMRRMLKGAAEAVQDGIAAELPSGRTGGRRVAPYATQSFATVQGTGRDAHGVAGTRWKLAHIIEFGSINNPAYAPLRKAAIRTGMRFEAGGR